MWSEILLILLSAFGAVYITFSIKGKHQDAKNTLLVTLISVIIFQINQLLEYEFISLVNEILTLTIFAAPLSLLLLTIRKLKPEFIRYPYPIAFFPYLIVLLYPLIAGERAIIILLLQLLQTAGLIAFLFIIISQVEKKEILQLLLLTLILLISGGVVFWYQEMIPFDKWLWQALTALGIGTGSYSISQFYNKNEIIAQYEN